jgi:hypothetical protein
MKVFGQFSVVACIGLLSWWRAALRPDSHVVIGALVLFGVAAAILTVKSRRLGYSLAATLGISNLGEIFWTVEPRFWPLVSPLLLWAAGLAAVSLALLWFSRPRKETQPVYERHAQY